MNILHITDISWQSNGMYSVLANLMPVQKSMGNNVMGITVRKKRADLPDLLEMHKSNDFSNLLNEFKPDIVIFHSLYAREYIPFYKKLLKENIPYIIQLHGAMSHGNYKKGHLKKWIANTLYFNRFIKKAQKIIYLNQFEYDESLVKFINPQSVIIPNGCTPHFGNSIAADRPKNRKTEILFLGRIDIHHKALDILIEAIHKLKNKGFGKDIHFTFYGNGENSDLEKFTKLMSPLEGFADFKGPVYGKDKESVYNKSDIFILTSRSEGMPMGVLEALSYGIPCFVTPQTNVANIINDFDCGWVTDLSSDAISENIIIATKDYCKRKVELTQSSLKAANDFSWDGIAAKTLDLYSDVISHNKTI